ncbi:carboxypeptidase M32 [Profundibacterium mesophilum]|uniref:Metal-dependent carboxypeptidase n=1 Tax=Profundibacterium mesophilum KAUST100406-0324 TaxID=1037889 RepID=A0A921NTE0_9RHOB|nr:carboxypeptidase M32 [Profundibacterium mesophilum]KAF0675190.1 Carboxypeptidase Taq Metallo peptidase MEROPS family M32 [Profundibacterium mesophilum KAUST100406-0324]
MNRSRTAATPAPGSDGAAAFAALMAHQRSSEALGQIAGRLGWDQETVMPRGASEQRSVETAALEEVLHARRSDPRVGEWLARAEAPDAAGAANLREIARQHERAARVPAALASELARVISLAQGKWAAARAAEDTGAFLPVLSEVVALRREEAAAIARGGDLYDTLLQDYEPGTSAAAIETLFAELRPGLRALRDRALGAGKAPPVLKGRFAPEQQRALAQLIAERFGYDMARGRIDIAVHPFSSGSGDDVRITTRVDPQDPFNCIYSTVHEVGHAAYEQNVSPAYALSAIGHGASMGVHESQSRLYENQLARSRPFTAWLHAEMSRRFGDLGMDEAEFYGAVNRLQRGFIRTEADEVQYNLHVMLRFELERSLIDGSLAVGDLEEAWCVRFHEDFGHAVDRPSNGMLQDVHWSVGLFGYFPTYTLGNVYAGCLNAALRRDLPELDTALAQGDPSPATAWLGEKVQRHGALRGPAETIAHATGSAPTAAPLLSYLDDKFSGIYGL